MAFYSASQGPLGPFIGSLANRYQRAYRPDMTKYLPEPASDPLEPTMGTMGIEPTGPTPLRPGQHRGDPTPPNLGTNKHI